MRQVISFDWQDQTWFPWFQFDRESGCPSPLVSDIVQVLASFLEPWQVACWFVQPNVDIDGHAPMDELAKQSAKVLAAAQACRTRSEGLSRPPSRANTR